jgi:aspartyl-tRNA(Asn)/glutamyl-tRNA(Gln) amidotransferase subunit C
MKIDKELLNKTAHLARLEFDETTADAMMKDMSEILTWVEKLNELDTADVAPLTTMSHEINVLRDDKAGEHLSRERALSTAPRKDSEFFRVPKVLE